METMKPSLQWGAKSHFNMVDVGSKATTQRRAQAQGQIHLSRESFISLRDGKNPKGNVLALAEVAGIMAAKKTSELIPLCHPLFLDQVQLSFQLNEGELSITVYCEVSTSAKTGVEMEALSGVHGALLCIYDLSKAVDPVITISNIRLNKKEGGKSGTWIHPDVFTEVPSQSQPSTNPLASLPLEGIQSVVITVSDRVHAGKAEDTSGPVIVSFLEQLGCRVKFSRVVPDEKGKIQAEIQRAVRENEVRLVITTGGTGLSPRDVTPEAIEGICDRIIPGLGECLRTKGAQQIQSAWISRSLGALLGQTLILALPGSRKAVSEGLETLKNILPHALHIAKGGGHD